MTKDLFKDYDPGPVVARFDESQVKGYSPAIRLAQAVSQVLTQSSISRDDIAARMSELTGERITRGMLDNYAAPSRHHQIPASRLAALTIVTADARALNELLRDAGMIVVPQKYEHLIRRERAKEMAEKLTRDAEAADAEWRARR